MARVRESHEANLHKANVSKTSLEFKTIQQARRKEILFITSTTASHSERNFLLQNLVVQLLFFAKTDWDGKVVYERVYVGSMFANGINFLKRIVCSKWADLHIAP